MLPDLKSGAIWALGVALAVAIASSGVNYVRLLHRDSEIARGAAATAEVEAQRTQIALDDANETIRLLGRHASNQQGIADELEAETQRRLAAERSNGELALSVRNNYTAYLAARDRAQAATDALASQLTGDRSCAVDEHARGAGELLARSADVVERARSTIQRRDSEVRALKAAVENDRDLKGAGPAQ